MKPIRLLGTKPVQFLAVSTLSALALFASSGCSGDDDDDDDDGDSGRAGAAGSSAGRPSGGAGAGGSSGSAGAAAGGTSGGQAGEGAGGEGGADIIDPDEFDGETVFRFDTFGSEQYWTDELRLHEAIQSALTPTMALELGLKVDASVLPEGILETVDLEDPATTVALIGMNAVVGIQGEVDGNGTLVQLGVTCALCHSSVDDSVMPGIGARLDGYANRELDVGAIIALAPALANDAAAQEVLTSWGPGYYDARWNIDGLNSPVLIPPAYGLRDVPVATYTGDGTLSYWNSYVAVTQMGGEGQFYEPRLDIAVIHAGDQVTPKLPSLYEYEISLEAPAPEAGSFNAAAATRGQALFAGAAGCNVCHSGPALSDAGERLHAAAETDMEPMAAERSATGLYRTTPLRALAHRPPYFHDGSAATLAAVVTHYNTALNLNLNATQQSDLVEYLKSL